MRYFLLLTLLVFAGCMDVRGFDGKSFTVVAIEQSIEKGKCRYKIESDYALSPNILYFDTCGKWQINDKVHFVTD